MKLEADKANMAFIYPMYNVSILAIINLYITFYLYHISTSTVSWGNLYEVRYYMKEFGKILGLTKKQPEIFIGVLGSKEDIHSDPYSQRIDINHSIAMIN